MPPKKPSELIREFHFPNFYTFMEIGNGGPSKENNDIACQLWNAYLRGCSREFLADCLEAKGL